MVGGELGDHGLIVDKVVKGQEADLVTTLLLRMEDIVVQDQGVISHHALDKIV